VSVPWLWEIFEAKLFTCSFQLLYIAYKLYNVCTCSINESIMMLWLAYLLIISQVALVLNDWRFLGGKYMYMQYQEYVSLAWCVSNWNNKTKQKLIRQCIYTLKRNAWLKEDINYYRHTFYYSILYFPITCTVIFSLWKLICER